ncbi:MAG: hypothetical protein CL670_14175 [Balneola sp.]|jgi:hypothetical protein|nr:hypothetical protein [Balneola sp.]MBE80301.1 hypothetical protein [Balneola sp.]HBX65604.1 hypothetical protein [Balneolaceae bacterium]|tara:strand:+ start:907 stop:1350 length:444 start_codon:yes stop_codon:yes gene_type:complete
MTFQFLPNVFKKIGLFIFVAAGIPAMKRGFIDGWNASEGISAPETFEAFTVFGVMITEPIYNLMSIIGVIGLLIYLFSKDRMMDEFLTKLRLEAVQLTFILTALFMFVMMVFNSSFKVSALGLIEYQLVLFLIINKAKKLWSLPGEE